MTTAGVSKTQTVLSVFIQRSMRPPRLQESEIRPKERCKALQSFPVLDVVIKYN